MGIFGNMFDFNGDGNLDVFEQGAELAFLDDLMREDGQQWDRANSGTVSGWNHLFPGMSTWN